MVEQALTSWEEISPSYWAAGRPSGVGFQWGNCLAACSPINNPSPISLSVTPIETQWFTALVCHRFPIWGWVDLCLRVCLWACVHVCMCECVYVCVFCVYHGKVSHNISLCRCLKLDCINYSLVWSRTEFDQTLPFCPMVSIAVFSFCFSYMALVQKCFFFFFLMHERWETNEVNSNFYVVIPPLHSTHKFNITSDSQWGRLWLHFLSLFPEETEFSKWKYQTRILLYINTFLNTVLSFLSTWGQEGAAQPEERSCRKQAMRMCLCTSVLLLQGDTKRGSGAEWWFPRPLIWLLGAAWSSGCRQRCSRRAWHSVHTACSHRRLPCWSHRQACCVPGPSLGL